MNREAGNVSHSNETLRYSGALQDTSLGVMRCYRPTRHGLEDPFQGVSSRRRKTPTGTIVGIFDGNAYLGCKFRPRRLFLLAGARARIFHNDVKLPS